MDSESLFLTANCDTAYFRSFVDLRDGPMVIDVPPLSRPSAVLGTSTTCGSNGSPTSGPGPDRGPAANI